jgi:hypothetical protein
LSTTAAGAFDPTLPVYDVIIKGGTIYDGSGRTPFLLAILQSGVTG